MCTWHNHCNQVRTGYGQVRLVHVHQGVVESLGLPDVRCIPNRVTGPGVLFPNGSKYPSTGSATWFTRLWSRHCTVGILTWACFFSFLILCAFRSFKNNSFVVLFGALDLFDFALFLFIAYGV